MLLWEEYKAIHPAGLQYSQFCQHYRAYARTLDLSMRQVHRAGEKCFIDYCGQTVPVVDARTGEIRQAQIFVAVLGASNYTYCEATWTQLNFQPVMKLIRKERRGAKVKKTYDRPQTPYQRLLNTPGFPARARQRLKAEYATLNPAALKREISQLQLALYNRAKKDRQYPHRRTSLASAPTFQDRGI